MNKEILLKDNKLIVKNENEDEREVLSVDNLPEILIQENIIEVIENVIKALEDSSKNFRKNKLKDLSSIPTPVLSSAVSPILFSFINELPKIINTKFGFMAKEEFIILFILAFIPFGYIMSKRKYQEYKDDLNCENGRQIALLHLRGNLDIQNTKLDLLKSKSKEVDVNYFKSCVVEDDESLDILQTHINLYYEIGYNLKYYYWYFMNNGELPNELKEEYNEAGQEIIKEFLVKNGPKVKKIGSK